MTKPDITQINNNYNSTQEKAGNDFVDDDDEEMT